MKRTIVGVAVALAAVAALRRFGPSLAQHAMAKCHEMMTGRSAAQTRA